MSPEPISFVWPLAGGLLVGLSAALYLLLNGRVSGISGLTAAATGLARSAVVAPPRQSEILYDEAKARARFSEITRVVGEESVP